MPLSNKQKNRILKNRKKYPAKKMAEKFDIPEDEINKYLDTLKKKTSPVYFYIILIGLPIIFFVLLELGLRIFGYGFN